MIIKATMDYTDKETREEIKAGMEFSVPRKRGLELINKGFARLVSEDDIVSANTTEATNLLHQKDVQIKELKKVIEERERLIDELIEQLPATKRAKYGG